jgi:hypothetical protein
MIRLIVEIVELKDERKGTNVAFRTEEEHPTSAEKFWEGRLYPVLKDALNMRGLLGERAMLADPREKP